MCSSGISVNRRKCHYSSHCCVFLSSVVWPVMLFWATVICITIHCMPTLCRLIIHPFYPRSPTFHPLSRNVFSPPSLTLFIPPHLPHQQPIALLTSPVVHRSIFPANKRWPQKSCRCLPRSVECGRLLRGDARTYWRMGCVSRYRYAGNVQRCGVFQQWHIRVGRVSRYRYGGYVQ